jgi:hypothetical protein
MARWPSCHQTRLAGLPADGTCNEGVPGSNPGVGLASLRAFLVMKGSPVRILSVRSSAARLRSRDVLTVIPVLEELALTLEEVAAGRTAPQDAEQRALVCDLDLALTRAGSSCSLQPARRWDRSGRASSHVSERSVPTVRRACRSRTPFVECCSNSMCPRLWHWLLHESGASSPPVESFWGPLANRSEGTAVH